MAHRDVGAWSAFLYEIVVGYEVACNASGSSGIRINDPNLIDNSSTPTSEQQRCQTFNGWVYLTIFFST